jgi:hypothetical protein
MALNIRDFIVDSAHFDDDNFLHIQLGLVSPIANDGHEHENTKSCQDFVPAWLHRQAKFGL